MRIMKFWFPAICYSGIIFFMSSLSKGPVTLPAHHFDKVVHCVEYGLLGLLVTWALIRSCPTMKPWQWVLIASLLCSLYGITDEFHQSFVPNREADLLDWVADSCGGFFGAFVMMKAWKRQSRMKS